MPHEASPCLVEMRIEPSHVACVYPKSARETLEVAMVTVTAA